MGELTRLLPLKVFVETGTYEGDSVRTARQYFDEIHTIESSQSLYEQAAKEFAAEEGIHVHPGRSQEVLQKLAPKLRRRSVLYWLDAHWCRGTTADDLDSECPLLDELGAIGSLSKNSVVLIDDARLFLAPPAEAAASELEDWPRFDEVLTALRGLAQGHEMMVVDDVIVFHPPGLGTLRRWARENGTDWLAEIERARSVEARMQGIHVQLDAIRRRMDRAPVPGPAPGAMESLERGMKVHLEDLQQLRAQSAAAQRLLAQLPELHEALKALERRTAAQVQASNTALAGLPATATEVKRLREWLQSDSQLQGLESGLGELRSQAEASAGSIDQLRSTSEASAASIEELRSIVEASAALLADLPATATEVKRLRESLQSDPRLQELETGVGELRSEVHASAGSIEELVSLRDWIEEVSARSRAAQLSLGGIPELRRELRGLANRLEQVVDAEPLAELPRLRQQVNVLSQRVNQLQPLRQQVAAVQRNVAAIRALQLDDRKGRAPGFLRSTLGMPALVGAKLAAAAGRGRGRVRVWARRSRNQVLRAFRLTRQRYRRGKLRLRRRFGRRLGQLDHHAPRQMRIPRRYLRSKPPADPPLISIVTPSFNQARFLERTIESVLTQGYPRLEYVVQDGGSTDGTRDVLERYGPRLHHWESRLDNGQAHAINLGFEHTSGDILAYLNADDLILPGTLAYVSNFFARAPNVDVVYGHRVLVDDDDMEIGRWVLPRHSDAVLSWADFIPQETMFWRRWVWEAAGGELDESFRFALDWDLILRFRAANARIVRLPRFLGAFRIHEEQKTSAQVHTLGLEEMGRLREREVGRPVAQPEIQREIRGYIRQHIVLQRLYRLRLLRY